MSRRISTAALPLAALALVTAMAPTACTTPRQVTASVRGGAATLTPAMTTTSRTTTAAPRIRSLTIGVSKGVVTMPSRLAAGTYYVHVVTPDPDASLEVVRPPANLSLTTWRAREIACMTFPPGETQQTSLKQCGYWRTSATFVGGANAVRTSSDGRFANPGGRATFAITLYPGHYWFYEDQQGHAYVGLKPLPQSAIRVITVVGPAEKAPVPVSAIATFSAGYVHLPPTMPRRGFVLGIGQPTIINVLWLIRMKPWVTQVQLDAEGQCFANSASAIAELRCWDGDAILGGGVSGGSSALWWYDLPPGEYIAVQGGLNLAGDAGLFPYPYYTRVTVQP